MMLHLEPVEIETSDYPIIWFLGWYLFRIFQFMYQETIKNINLENINMKYQPILSMHMGLGAGVYWD